MKRTLLAAIGLFIGVGCGASASQTAPVFARDWQNDSGRSIAALHAKLAAQSVVQTTSIALGVTSTELLGLDLNSGARWKFSIQASARPAIAGGVVVASDRTSVVVLDAQSGRLLTRLPSEGRALVGAGDDGRYTAITLGLSRGTHLLLVVNRSGEVVLRYAPNFALGQPAVLAGHVFVPWNGQYVSVLDAGTGEEVARLLTREQASRALVLDGKLYFGERALVRFDERIGNAWQNAASTLRLPRLPLPGNPRWFTPGSAPERPVASASDHIQIAALPATSGTGLNSGQVLASYFRLAFGFTASERRLRWVRAFTRDLIDVSAAKNGAVFCDESGQVHLDHMGQGGKSYELGARLQSCVLQTDSFEVAAVPRRRTLSEQVEQAVTYKDAELVTAQRLLVAELGAIDDPYATQVLIKLASDATTPPELLQEARAALPKRRSGADYMLAALSKHYDFLSDVLLTPPVGPLADALAAMNERRAAPLLAEHLSDPANPPMDVQRAAHALEVLASDEQFEALRTFFALYRASAEQPEMIDAVLSVGRTMRRIGGEEGRRIVEAAMSDPLTHPEIQKGLAAPAYHRPSEAPKSAAGRVSSESNSAGDRH